MKLTALIAALCVLAAGVGMLIPNPHDAGQAQAEPQIPTLVAGQR